MSERIIDATAVASPSITHAPTGGLAGAALACAFGEDALVVATDADAEADAEAAGDASGEEGELEQVEQAETADAKTTRSKVRIGRNYTVQAELRGKEAPSSRVP